VTSVLSSERSERVVKWISLGVGIGKVNNSNGNYFFASCATSSDVKESDDYETIEILNKEGKSLKILWLIF